MSVHSPSGKFPKQRLSLKEKTKSDFKWARDMVDYLCSNYADDRDFIYNTYEDGDSTGHNSDTNYHRMLANYRLYNNVIDQKDFERECNPLGIEVGQFKDSIKAYNKMPNKIQVLLGEELKRPFNYKVVLTNKEGIRSKLEEKNRLLREYVTTVVDIERQKVMQSLQGVPQQEIEEAAQARLNEVMPPEMIEKYMRTTFRESREILGSNLLKYLVRKENIKDKKNDGFKHGLIAGGEFCYVGVVGGDLSLEILNPLGVFYHKSPDVKFIQDSLFAGYRTMMSSGDILDKFGEFLKNDDIEKIQGELQSIHGADKDLISKSMKYHNIDIFQKMEADLYNSGEEGAYGRADFQYDVPVVHLEWVSQKKVGFVSFINEFQEEEIVLVNEDFQIPPHAVKTTEIGQYNKKTTIWMWDEFKLKWDWIPEVWSAVRINGDIYCCMGPKPYQHRSINNPKKVKLGYHGLVYNSMNASPVSLMDRMRPFQFLYFITVHKLKRLIAKDKGQVFHFDTSMLPEKMSLEKTLYYLEEMDIDFFNPLQNAELPGAHQRGKIAGSTSRSNMQHILNYVQLMDAIDQQISDVAGITRQREGQGSPTETVGNNRQAIQASSHITEAVYFHPHDKLWESILESMVECAQALYKDKPLMAQYVLDDFSMETLNISPGELTNTDLGVFMINSSRENEIFRTLQELAQPLLQNDKAKFSDIIKMLKLDSTEQLTRQIEQSESEAEARQQQEVAQQQEIAQQQIQAEKELQEDQQAHEKELKELEMDTKIRVAEIQSFAFQQDQDVNNNNIPDQLEVAKFEADKEFRRKELEIKEKELTIKRNQTKQKNTSK